MEKVVVSQEKCIGCGICVGQNPKYFIFNDQGLSEAVNIELESEEKASVLESIEMCPTEAIIIEEN